MLRLETEERICEAEKTLVVLANEKLRFIRKDIHEVVEILKEDMLDAFQTTVKMFKIEISDM